MFNRNCCGRANPMMGYGMPMMNQGMVEQPVVEPTINKCVEKEFFHEIPHVCPIHTHTVNRHVYKHTYTPQFTCSEECQVNNIDCGKCSNFV